MDIVSAVLSAIAAALNVIMIYLVFRGWEILKQDSASSSSRAEAYAKTEKIADLLIELHSAAREQWSEKPDSRMDPQLWISNTGRYVKLLRCLSKILWASHGIVFDSKKISEVRQAYTLDIERIGTMSLSEIKKRQRLQDRILAECLATLYSCAASQASPQLNNPST